MRQNISTEKPNIPCCQPYNFSPAEFFWNIEEFSMNLSGSVRQNFFILKTWYPIFLLIHKNFSIPQTFKNFEGIPTIQFGSVRQENLTQIVLPPSCPYISSHNRSFLNHRRYSNEKLRYRDTKDFDGKILTSPSLIHTNFSLPQLFRNSEEFSMFFFGNVRLGKFNGKTWYRQSHS